MATPTPPNTGPSIGTSRLLGTNGLQQAVDSLTTQINRLTATVGAASRTSASSNNGGSAFGAAWNQNSNRIGNANGGGGRFTLGGMNGGASNGGNANFAGLSRAGAVAGAVAGVGSALVNYANKNMASSFQYDYFGTQSSVAGGGGRAGNNLAIQLAANNNYVGLNTTDRVRAGYLNQYTFGNAQFNGQANPAFVSGMRQANAFGYANPTLGAYGAAQAAQQTYSARAAYVAPALGLASPYLPGGVKNSMQNIAQSIYQRTFGSQRITNRQLNAALSQGGSLDVNLQYFGAQLGWNQSTIQEYRNVLQGQVAAQNKGMSETKYYNLLGQAAGGNRSAINQLAKTTNMGTSMFENQRNLNAVRTNREIDILKSLAPAFDTATQAVTKFSQALNTLLQSTGLDKAIGASSGFLAPFSNALGGMSGGFGAGLGLLGASRLLGGGGGILGRLAGLFGRGGAGAAAAGEGGLINGGLVGAGAGSGGANVITSLGAGGAGASGGGILSSLGPAGLILGGVSYGGYQLSKLAPKGSKGYKHRNDSFGQWLSNTFSWQGVKDTFNVKENTKDIWQPIVGLFGGATGSGGVTGTTGNSARNSSTQGASTASAAQIIKYAETQLGVKYVWGAEQPGKGFDCSGLTQWAYGKAGVKIPRVAADQQKVGTKVPTNKTQPGDLLFVGNPAHHVVMSIGGNKIIEAPHPGSHVLIRTLNPSEFTSATRIVGSIGNMNSLLNENTDNSGNTLNNQQNTSGGDLGNLSGTSEAAAIASALAGSASSVPMVAQSQNTSTTNNAGTGGNPKATGNNSPSHLKSYAKALLNKYGWGNQWDAFNALEISEAGWNVHATNPSSGAYGLAQALPASKYNSAGKDWKTSGETQLRWMMDYIKQRYGSPASAWSFHQKNNWYDKGAWSIDKDQDARVHKGEMIIPAQQAETIRQTLINNTFNPNLQRAAGTGGSNATVSIGNINVTLPESYSGSASDARQIGKTIVDAMEEQIRIKNLQIGQ